MLYQPGTPTEVGQWRSQLGFNWELFPNCCSESCHFPKCANYSCWICWWQAWSFLQLFLQVLTLGPGYLLLGCDGVWERYTNQEIVDFLLPRLVANAIFIKQMDDSTHMCLCETSCLYYPRWLSSIWVRRLNTLKATKRRALLQSLLWILRSWGIRDTESCLLEVSFVVMQLAGPQVLCQKTPWGLNMLAARIWLFRLFLKRTISPGWSR